MDTNFSGYEKYLSDELDVTAKIISAYILKVGFIRLQFNLEFGKKFSSEKEEFREGTETLIAQIYKSLQDSPHVMDVTPSKDELLLASQKNKSKIPLFFRHWITEKVDALSFSKYIQSRVVLPKKKKR